ncbi:hypothetical protein [Amycolatopsis panacis]|uniref:hypothetical protein n=1 Tax=Amycolatopsis panacis TaxID=2340917 RepID=UPI0011C422AB|nr:hypothetical protein [Amycolatopsis panacis]
MFELVSPPFSAERQDDGRVGGVTRRWQRRSGQGDCALDLVSLFTVAKFEPEGFEQSPRGVFG